MKSQIVQRLAILPVILLIAACSSPNGDKSVAVPTVGDSTGGGTTSPGDGATNPGDGATNPGGGTTNPSTCSEVTFTSQTRVGLSTTIDSDTLTISGCTEPVLISVTGDGTPQLYKNGVLVVTSTTINTGDTLRVRITTSSTESATFQATVSVGSGSSVFSVTTGDFTPAAFSFAPSIGQALSANVTSNQATLSGFDGSLTATATGTGSPIILVNGSVIGASASVVSGDAISVRLTTAATVSTTRQATVTINGVVATFDVTTTGDATAPTITSVSAPANGSYKQSTNLDFTANFSENVTVTGTPRIILNIGGTTKYANYFSGSGTATSVFRYVVEAAVNDTDGISVESLQLNGGTINDTTSNVADLSFVPPNTAAVLVDTTPSSVQTATGPANGTYAPGQYLSFALTFNESVNVTGTPRLMLTIGSTTRYADYLSGTGSSTLNFRYTVQAGDSDSDGIALAATIDLNSGTLSDTAMNAASLAFTAPNMSSVNVTACPTGYVPIAALSPYTTSQFCVAKYEMKNVSGVATSTATGTAWVNISRDSSITACTSIGTGYSLISNAQWQTIARNLEGVGFNWSGETVGSSGGMSRGHSDNSPGSVLSAVSDDNDSCSGTGQTCSLSTWSDQRRVHQLANGSYIWDIAGNVAEWVIDNNSTNFGGNPPIAVITTVSHPTTGSIGGVSNNAYYHFGPAGNYTGLSTSPYGGLGYGYLNYSAGAITRGGSWNDSEASGVFAAYLGYDHDGAAPNFGFRCVWTP